MDRRRAISKAFLKDTLKLSTSCFGGPQAHLAHFQRTLVERGRYLSREELFELYAFCQLLPGASSTQTLVSIGYRLGGASLAYLTLLVWVLPSTIALTLAAFLVVYFQARDLSVGATRFIQPMAVGFVSYAAYNVILKMVRNRTGVAIMAVAGALAFFIRTPVIFPIILLGAGLVTAFNYKLHPREPKKAFDVSWKNLFLWVGVFVAAAALAELTQVLPIRLFSNFYRNGSLIFGGGQALVSMLYTEFVQYAPKQYLTAREFLLGYSLMQAMPGPTFSFSAYVGALAMRDFGWQGEVVGALAAVAGAFLPGAFVVFFAAPIWDSLRRFRPVKASLEGINAASAGLVTATAILLFQPVESDMINLGIIAATFGLLIFSRTPSWAIVILGLLLGLIL